MNNEIKQNGLVSPKLWDDPFENFFLNCTAVTNEGEYVNMSSLANSWYGQCWTYNQDSDAMWRIYSPKKDGVKVSTTIRKLFSSIFNTPDPFAHLKYFIGKVNYLEREDIEGYIIKTTTFNELALGGSANGFAQTLCMKRKEFSHESEVRLLFNDTDKNIGNGEVAQFNFDWKLINR